MGVAQHGVRNSVGDRLPRLAVVLGAKDERIAIVDLVPVYREVCRAGVVTRRFDVRHRAPLRELVNIGRDIGPRLAAIARELHIAVIGAGPDQARLFGRFGDGKHHAGIFHADIVAREAARESLPRFVIARQIGTDDLPGVALVGSHMNVLAAHVDLIAIVR